MLVPDGVDERCVAQRWRLSIHECAVLYQKTGHVADPALRGLVQGSGAHARVDHCRVRPRSQQQFAHLNIAETCGDHQRCEPGSILSVFIMTLLMVLSQNKCINISSECILWS